MKPIRLGIIGAGPIVEKKHLPALADVADFDVVAVCRRNTEALEQLATRFRIAGRYNDYRSLLEDERIDAVLIAAGPPGQADIVAAAATAGKHILVEKPLAESAAETVAMCDAVKKAGVAFQVGFNKRFYYGYRQARRIVDAGELGTLTGVDARFWYQSGRRDPLLHNGIHFLDLMRFLGGPVSNVFARHCTVVGAAGESLSISLAFDNGAVGSLLLSSFASWDYPNERLDAVGSNGNALSVENGRSLRVFRRGEGRPSELHENTLSVHWWSGHDEQGFATQLRFFAGQIRGSMSGAEVRLAAGIDDGVASLCLLEAVSRSIQEGAPAAVLQMAEAV